MCSPSISQALGLATQASTGFAAADIERSSLILCGRAFADANAIRDALAALAAPVISARGGLPVTARYQVPTFLHFGSIMWSTIYYMLFSGSLRLVIQ